MSTEKKISDVGMAAPRLLNLRWPVIFGACAVCMSTMSNAADWRLLPHIEAGGYYTDNYEFTEISTGKVDATAFTSDLQFMIRGTTPRSVFIFVPRVNAEYFANNTADDTLNSFAVLNYKYLGQRSNIGVNVDYGREAIFQTESIGSENMDLGRPNEVTLSAVKVRNRQDRIEVAPIADFDLSQRFTSEIYGRFLDVKYDQLIVGEQQDYSDVSASVGIGYRVTPTSTLSIVGKVAEFRPSEQPGMAVESSVARSTGASAKWQGKFSETQQYYVELGAARTRFDRLSGNALPPLADQTGFVGGIGTSWAFRVTTIFLDVSRSQQPNATGSLSVQNELRLQLERQLSQKVKLFSAVHLVKSGEYGVPISDDRRYVNAEVGMDWHWTPALSLVGQYSYRWRKYDSQASSAAVNGCSISIVYELPRTTR